MLFITLKFCRTSLIKSKIFSIFDPAALTYQLVFFFFFFSSSFSFLIYFYLILVNTKFVTKVLFIRIWYLYYLPVLFYFISSWCVLFFYHFIFWLKSSCNPTWYKVITKIHKNIFFLFFIFFVFLLFFGFCLRVSSSMYCWVDLSMIFLQDVLLFFLFTWNKRFVFFFVFILKEELECLKK